MTDTTTLFIDKALLSCDVVVAAMEAAGVDMAPQYGLIDNQFWRSFEVRELTALGIASIVKTSGIPVYIEVERGVVTIKL